MSWFNKKRIFLDHAAGEENPSAIYKEGVEARRRLEDARTKIARVLQCQARDVIFTSGGTESDNLAVFGVVEAAKEAGIDPHIIISAVEHPAIKEAAKKLEKWGVEVTVVPVEEGNVDPHAVLSALRENTVLVSIMYVNNETGAVHPVPKVARLVADYRRKKSSRYPYVHTDASQAAMYLPVDISRLGVDLMTLDASKVGGTLSTGVLVVRPSVALRPQLVGGSQERGLRAGTENISAVVQFAEALEKAQRDHEETSKRIGKLKEVFMREAARLLKEAVVNTPAESVPGIVSITLPGKLHEFVAVQLDEKGVAVSTGSSCSTSKDEEEKEALRFSFGPSTTEREIHEAVRILADL